MSDNFCLDLNNIPVAEPTQGVTYVFTPKQKRFTWVEWVEPFNDAGDEVYCRVTKATAIRTQKQAARSVLKDGQPFQYADDEAAYGDFLVVRWATTFEGDEHGQKMG